MEPFCGGLTVTLSLRPNQALLNDTNPHAINLYLWLKRGFRVDLPMCNDELLYYARRELFNELITDGQAAGSEAAALFYYLNRTCYRAFHCFNDQGFQCTFRAP